jgi:hypothetical protein
MPSTIWVNDQLGIHTQHITLPNHWQGETECVVGPFSSQKVAQLFAMTHATFRQVDVSMDTIFPYRDGWYIQIKPLQTQKFA